MKLFRALSIAAAALAAGRAGADLDIAVVKQGFQPYPIAIVPFAQPPEVSTDVAQIVDADLARSGYFDTLPRNNMLEKPSEEPQIDYRNWTALGRQFLAIGKLSGGPGGAFSAESHLFDVGASQRILDISASAHSQAEWRSAGHVIADQIFEKITGKRGVFNTRIAYITANGPVNNRRYQLIIADSDGENPKPIATSREPLMSPAWSPDGSRIAYVGYERGNSAIYIQTPATGELRKFVGERGINGSPTWSPDGSKLAVTLSFERNPDIYVIDVASGSRTRLTSDYSIDTESTWSPDGRTIAFTSDRGGSAQIYMMNADGSNQHRITFSGKQNLRPRFSPDGQTLALVHNEGSGYTIGLLDLQTNALRIVSNGPLDESPNFAPNSALVIYTAQGARGTELATVSTDGRVRQSLRQSGEVREPAWGPFSH
jgi:TolB protein